MKIVQISSLWERTPPPKYGGLELVVSNLTEELVKRGHEVTLFATGDSKTAGILKAYYPRPLYRDGVPWTSMNDSLTAIAEAVAYAEEWGADIIHHHQSHRGLAIMSLSRTPFVNTIHGTLQPEVVPADRLRTFRFYKDQPFVSISNYQRRNARYLNWVKTAYNGIEVERFRFNAKPKADYLLWIGRFTETKAPHLAIRYAKQLKMKLVMAGKLDQQAPKDLEYFERTIKPELKKGVIEWVGEVDHKGKTALYRDALCLLNPIQWDEPFGLVNVEAMACGTPVVTYERGAMRELIADKKTGFLIKPGDEKGFVAAIKQTATLSRRACRKRAEQRFSVGAMVDSYLEAYGQVIKTFPEKRSLVRRIFG